MIRVQRSMPPSGNSYCMCLRRNWLKVMFTRCHQVLEDKKPSGQGPKPTQATTKTSSANPTAQKPAAYRPPHAKTAAAIQAESDINLLGSMEDQDPVLRSNEARKRRLDRREKLRAKRSNPSAAVATVGVRRGLCKRIQGGQSFAVHASCSNQAASSRKKKYQFATTSAGGVASLNAQLF